jgi:hypothetical protein
VAGVTEATGSAWSYGGSILTFLFPMILFLVVAVGLYVIYTKPSVVPGHREQAVARPIGFTPVVRMPAPDQQTAGPAAADGPHDAFPAQAEQAGGEGQAAPAGGGEAAAPENPAARPGNPEAAE